MWEDLRKDKFPINVMRETWAKQKNRNTEGLYVATETNQHLASCLKCDLKGQGGFLG